jgi:integrase
MPRKTRHRANNEGSVYQVRDNLWAAAITIPPDATSPTGKPRRKVLYAKTRKEAFDKLTEALHNVQHNRVASYTPSGSLGDYIVRWLETSARPRIRPTTYVGYEVCVRVHILPALGQIPLNKLTPQHVQSFLADRERAGKSPRTIQYAHTILKSALTQAVKWGLLDRNVAALVDGRRVQHDEIHPLTPDQSQIFLQAIKGERMEALYVLAIGLGLRKGELLGLRWSDIDFERHKLTVRTTTQRIEGKVRLLEPKTKASRRSINLPKFVEQALLQHRERHQKERTHLYPTDTLDLVFPTTNGTPTEPRNLSTQFARLLTRLAPLGVPRIRFHDLRHSMASLMMSQGVPIKVISEILGHTKINITLDIYGHLYDHQRQEAAQKLDDLLGNPNPEPAI